jgi:hypothetical protein
MQASELLREPGCGRFRKGLGAVGVSVEGPGRHQAVAQRSSRPTLTVGIARVQSGRRTAGAGTKG